MSRLTFIKDLIAKKSIHSLSSKLIIGIGGLIFLGSITFWYSNIHTVEEETLKTTVNHASTYIDLIRKSSYYNMLTNKTEAVQESLQTMTSEDGVTSIRIFDIRGTVHFASDRNEVGKTIAPDSEVCLICHSSGGETVGSLHISPNTLVSPQWKIIEQHGTRAIKSVLPIFNDRPCYTAACHFHKEKEKILGILETDFSLRKIDEKIRQQKITTAIFGVIFTAFASVILCIILWIIVISPLLKLTEGMKAVSKGDLDRQIDIRSKDEIGILAGTFNAMTKEIKAAREKLEHWAKELEEEVARKTEEIRRGQEQFVHTEKLASLGRMAAGVAHEINSPLTGIVTFAHLMIKRLPPENKMDREDLEVIIEQAERCSRIIKGLLGFSRAIPAEKNEVNVGDTMRHAVSMIQNQAKFHNVKMDLEVDDGIPLARGDSSQIEQVFLNLLINAADAMNDRGKIAIRISQTTVDETLFIEIAVSDTGPGIPEEYLTRLFEPFFTTKPVGKGTGLGLAVSHGIIKKHGGHIVVKSTPGKGASFFVRLPINSSGEPGNRDGDRERHA